MKKSKALLMKYLPETDGSGNVSKSLTEVCEIKGVFIPSNTEMASTSKGYTENVSWDFFYRGNNRELVTGNVIRYRDEDFIIVAVANMGRVKIVKLNSVVGTRNRRNVVQVLNY